MPLNQCGPGLRVLLIQKDFKLLRRRQRLLACLRVLLIQKDFKHLNGLLQLVIGLRVLLIQKDFKLVLMVGE